MRSRPSFLAFLTAGAWSTAAVTPVGDPIVLSTVVLLSVGPAIVGSLLAWLLISFVPRGRTVFLAVAALVLVAFTPARRRRRVQACSRPSTAASMVG